MNAKKAALQRVADARSAMTRIMNAVPAAMRPKFTVDAVTVASSLTDAEVANMDEPDADEEPSGAKEGPHDGEGKRHTARKHVKP